MSNPTQPTVTMYTTSSCGFCQSEKQYFDTKNITYTAKNIEEDESAFNELIEKIGGRQNFRGVPVTDIDGELVLGFDRPKLNQLLNIS